MQGPEGLLEKAWDPAGSRQNLCSLKGHRQVHHALHRGGDRREHVNGGPPEDDGGRPGLQGVGVRL